MTKKTEPEDVQEIKAVRNPLQMIILILGHPKFYIPVIITIIIIFILTTIRIEYKDGKLLIEKANIRVEDMVKK